MHFSSFKSVGFVLIVAIMVVAIGCQQNQSDATSESIIEPLVILLGPESFLNEVTADDVVIDVRTPEEFEAGHLRGAMNLNVRSDDFRAGVELLDRDTKYFLYCRTGNRSQQAAQIMNDLGFKAVYNVGGFEALAEAGADTTSR